MGTGQGKLCMGPLQQEMMRWSSLKRTLHKKWRLCVPYIFSFMVWVFPGPFVYHPLVLVLVQKLVGCFYDFGFGLILQELSALFFSMYFELSITAKHLVC